MLSKFVFGVAATAAFLTVLPSIADAQRHRGGGGGGGYGRGGGGGGYGGGYDRPRREMFPATCSQCGKDTQVPFQPRGDKPVYCSDCFESVRSQRY